MPGIPYGDDTEIVAFDPFGAIIAATLLGAVATGALMTLWGALLRQSMVAPGGMTINFPFANGFTQIVDPSTNWGIIGHTRRPDVERAILNTTSYGSQLGRMMDVVRDLAQHDTKADPEKRRALEELAQRIDKIKQDYNLAS